MGVLSIIFDQILMRDDQRCQIKLTHSSQRQDLTLYHLEINYHSQLYRLACRYSKLRLIAMTLPQTSTPFPPPQHLEKIITSFLGNPVFLQKRLYKLQAYFEAVTESPQLESSLGLAALVQEGQRVEKDGEEEEHARMPRAPMLRGKQLVERVSDGSQMLVVC